MSRRGHRPCLERLLERFDKTVVAIFVVRTNRFDSLQVDWILADDSVGIHIKIDSDARVQVQWLTWQAVAVRTTVKQLAFLEC